MPLASSKRIAKIAFTGSTSTGRVIAQAAANNLIPATLELGGKSPNIFFADVMAARTTPSSTRPSKAWCCSPSTRARSAPARQRALIQEVIYDKFMGRAPWRVAPSSRAPAGHRHHDRRPGLQGADDQDHVLPRPRQAGGRRRGADRRQPAQLGGDLAGGYYVQPTLFKGHNKMRIFQEEIFGPVLAVTTFKDEAEALADRQRHAVRPGRRRVEPQRQPWLPHGPRHQAGRVWTNCYHAYPAHAAFGGYKGIGHRPRDPQDDARPLPAGCCDNSAANCYLPGEINTMGRETWATSGLPPARGGTNTGNTRSST